MLIFLFFIGFCFTAFALTIADHKLLKLMHSDFKKEWEAIGKPQGMFFKPEGSSVISMWKYAFIGKSKKFAWVDGNQRAEYLLSGYNKLKAIFIVYCIILVPSLLLLIIDSKAN